MKNEKEPSRKPAERKPSQINNNVVFAVIILGVVLLVALFFMQNRTGEKLSYSDLVRAIKVSDNKEGNDYIEIPRDKGEKEHLVRFSHPTDIKIGTYEIAGKITRESPLDKPARSVVEFQTNTKPGNERIAQLLEEKHIEFDNSDGPSAGSRTFRCSC